MNMLRELLWAAEAKMSYDRGKDTGLAGLFGIALVILCVWQWDDLIHPLLTNMGVVSFADKIGLVYEGASEITLLRVVGFLVALSLTLAVIGVALLVLFFIVCGIVYAVSQSPFLKWLLRYTLLLPLKGALYVVLSPLLLIEQIIIRSYQALNPKGYAERKAKAEEKRLAFIRRMDRELISYIRYFNPTEVRLEEAFLRLNRLPMKGDDNFLIGITQDEEVYMLVPSPYYWKTQPISKEDNLEDFDYNQPFLSSQKMTEKYFDGLRLEYIDAERREDREMKITNDQKSGEHKKVPLSSIEKIYHIREEKRVHYQGLFKLYGQVRAYIEYTDYIQKRYLYNLEKLLNLSETVDSTQYPHVMRELVKYSASNADMIALMKNGSAIKWEGEQSEERRV